MPSARAELSGEISDMSRCVRNSHSIFGIPASGACRGVILSTRRVAPHAKFDLRPHVPAPRRRVTLPLTVWFEISRERDTSQCAVFNISMGDLVVLLNTFNISPRSLPEHSAGGGLLIRCLDVSERRVQFRGAMFSISALHSMIWLNVSCSGDRDASESPSEQDELCCSRKTQKKVTREFEASTGGTSKQLNFQLGDRRALTK
ncbi:hypothetical protein C8R45DRAFT_940526 [Mycena sanguinolenta]|nr:hypothetical protein C8R45DRAFT_940526 [Mycena sanguinolenta]